MKYIADGVNMRYVCLLIDGVDFVIVLDDRNSSIFQFQLLSECFPANGEHDGVVGVFLFVTVLRKGKIISSTFFALVFIFLAYFIDVCNQQASVFLFCHRERLCLVNEMNSALFHFFGDDVGHLLVEPAKNH